MYSDQSSAASLFRSYKKCLETLAKRKTALSTLTSIHPPELIAQWESMDDVPKLVNGKVYSVYEARFQNGELYYVFHVICVIISDVIQLCQLDFKHISHW